MPSDRHNADDVLALALASGHTIQVAAKLADVSESTVARRLRSRRFRRRVAGLRTRIIETAVSRLASGCTKATDKFVALVDDPNPQVALQAARSVLGLTGSLWKGIEQEAEIDGIREDYERLKQSHPEMFKGEKAPYDRPSND